MDDQEKYLTSEKVSAIRMVKQVVAEYYSQPISDFESKSRKSQIVKLKHVSIYLVNYFGINLTLTYIASLFNCNHATVIHARKKITGYLEFDKDLALEINYLITRLESIKKIKAISKIENEKFYDSKMYYHLDLNDFISSKINDKKSIILVGHTNEEIQEFVKLNSIKPESLVAVQKTGMFILKKLK